MISQSQRKVDADHAGAAASDVSGRSRNVVRLLRCSTLHNQLSSVVGSSLDLRYMNWLSEAHPDRLDSAANTLGVTWEMKN